MGDPNTTSNTGMASTGGAHQLVCREYVVRRVARCMWLNAKLVQQCQVITPLQLYFSYKAAFTNVQVRRGIYIKL